jgi:intein-encoded DNA endonuclease-like protein
MRFLGQDLAALVSLIEHCTRCIGAFLRGFYDSEASIRGRQLRVHNGDLDKLKLACSLLSLLGIEATGPHLKGEKGGTVSIKGKLYHVNKDQYYVYVRTSSLIAFSYSVGFTIRRKQERLKEAVIVRGRG